MIHFRENVREYNMNYFFSAPITCPLFLQIHRKNLIKMHVLQLNQNFK